MSHQKTLSSGLMKEKMTDLVSQCMEKHSASKTTASVLQIKSQLMLYCFKTCMKEIKTLNIMLNG